MPVKVSLYYQCNRQGVNEQWLDNSTNALPAVGSYPRYQGFGLARLICFGHGVTWIGMRVSEVPAAGAIPDGFRPKSMLLPITPGVATVFGNTGELVNTPALSGMPNSAGAKSDIPNSALIMRVTDGGGNRSIRYMGVPPDGILGNGSDQPDVTGVPNFASNLSAFFTQVQTDHWAFRSRNNVAPFDKKPVLAYRMGGAGANSLGIVLLGGAPVYPAGALIQIRKAKVSPRGALSPLGQWRIDYSEADTVAGQWVHWLKNSVGIAPSSIIRNGTVQAVGYQYGEVNAWQVEGAGTHRRGKVFQTRVGRRSNR